jgi:hypothetical protein
VRPCDTRGMAKRPPRPRDPMQLAKLIGDIATGERPNDSPRPETESEETAWRRKGGRKGGKARAKKLAPNRRAAIAKKAARARWRNT